MDVRHDPAEGPAVQGDEAAFGQGPAEPRTGQAERGGLREGADLGGRHQPGDLGADSVMERIAGGQDAGRLSPAGEDLRIGVLDRARPGPGLRVERAGEG